MWQYVNLLRITARRYNLVGVTRRQHRYKSVPVGHKAVTVQGGYGVVFAVRVQVLRVIRVSRYNVDREQVTSQGTQKLYSGQWRGRGINYYKSVKEAGVKAKTMTSPLIIPSVLGFRAYF